MHSLARPHAPAPRPACCCARHRFSWRNVCPLYRRRCTDTPCTWCPHSPSRSGSFPPSCRYVTTYFAGAGSGYGHGNAGSH